MRRKNLGKFLKDVFTQKRKKSNFRNFDLVNGLQLVA